MGKIFPMASLVVRLGLVRKREKEARRAALAQSQLTLPATALEPKPADARPLSEATSKPVPTGLQRYNLRRSREAKRKAAARRLKEDMTVSAAVKDFEKVIRDTVWIIARVPKIEWDRILAHDPTKNGEETSSFVFKRSTSKARRELSVITRKYRAAAKRLTASIAEARGIWEATLAEYRRNELIKSSPKAGGRS
jgi:hypothetical protein